MTEQEPLGVIFDLFGTLVSIDADLLPREESEGHRRIATIAGLEALLASLTPVVAVDEFNRRLLDVSHELLLLKSDTCEEIPSVERFLRTLRSFRLSGDLDAVAKEMSQRHMASLAAAVVCPAGRAELLRSLGARYRLGLVSNFDHGPTAHAVLRSAGIDGEFSVAVISDDVGIRKPAPEIFLRACRALALEPSRCLHVGDSYDEDVLGAHAAGLTAIWLSEDGGDPQPAVDAIRAVEDLPAWLARRFGSGPG